MILGAEIGVVVAQIKSIYKLSIMSPEYYLIKDNGLTATIPIISPSIVEIWFYVRYGLFLGGILGFALLTKSKWRLYWYDINMSVDWHCSEKRRINVIGGAVSGAIATWFISIIAYYVFLVVIGVFVVFLSIFVEFFLDFYNAICFLADVFLYVWLGGMACIGGSTLIFKEDISFSFRSYLLCILVVIVLIELQSYLLGLREFTVQNFYDIDKIYPMIACVLFPPFTLGMIIGWLLLLFLSLMDKL